MWFLCDVNFQAFNCCAEVCFLCLFRSFLLLGTDIFEKKSRSVWFGVERARKSSCYCFGV